jgi:radical SAM protein with 4Fe4S-binding SPASM domain
MQHQSAPGSIQRHVGFDVAFDSIKRLADHGANQINIHYLISEQTYKHVFDLINAVKTDPRLKKVNAIVFLGLKQKGRGVRMDTVDRESYKQLVDYCLSNNVTFGFDSCSAPAFVNAIIGHKDEAMFKTFVEDCESTLFSSYIDVNGMFYPCSFTEGEGNWTYGIDVVSAEDFVKDVWNHPMTSSFRHKLLSNKDGNGCKNCPVHCVNGVDMRLPEFGGRIELNILE